MCGGITRGSRLRCCLPSRWPGRSMDVPPPSDFLALSRIYGSQLFLALAYTSAFLNLFNLVPVLGLDGAQATYALNRLQRFLIVVSCVLLYALLREWVYLAIAAGMAWRSFFGNRPGAAEREGE